MLTYALITLMFATDATPPTTTPEIAKADADVALAAKLQRECWNPDECALAATLAEQAKEELHAAMRLNGHQLVASYVDPFQPDYVEPFEDMTVDQSQDAERIEAEMVYETVVEQFDGMIQL